MTAPLAYSVPDAAAAVGISERALRLSIANSELPVRYWNSKPLVGAEDLAAWFKGLPSESPAERRRAKA